MTAGNIACLRCPDASKCFAEGHCYMLEPASITPRPGRPVVGWTAPKPHDVGYPGTPGPHMLTVKVPFEEVLSWPELPVTMAPNAADDPNPGPRAMGWISPDRAAQVRKALNRAHCSNVEEFVSEQIAVALDLLKA